MKQHRFCLVVLIILWGNVHLSHGQNLFQNNQSGFDFSGYFSSQNDISRYSLFSMFSLNGLFDFGLGIGRNSVDEEEYGFELYSTVTQPYLGFQMIKQSPTVPISLTVGLSYAFLNFGGDLLEESRAEMTGNTFSIGGLLYGCIDVSPNFSFIPTIGISFYKSNVKLEDRSYTRTYDTDGTAFSLGMTFKFNLENNNFLFLDPNVSFEDGESLFVIGLGFGLPVYTKIKPDAYDSQEIDRSSDLDALFSEVEPIYLEIKNILKDFILVYGKPNTVFNLGDTYPVVRKISAGYVEIGSAKVVKITEGKIALQYWLADENNSLTKADFVQYQ